MLNQADVSAVQPIDESVCWQAMLDRDARYDGKFVCGVHSTGIYCRPSCPARKPHRENVSFFADPEAAERAGLRPCKRCRPQAVSVEAEIVEKVCRYIEAHLHEDVSLATLGAHVNYSPFHLQRLFKRALGISPRQYAEAARVERLKVGLKEAESVTDAMYGAGYTSSSQLYDGKSSAWSTLGMEPSRYRQGGCGAEMGYTIVDSALGRLLVAATQCGISAVYLDDSDEQLESTLHSEFPNATIIRDDEGFGEWVDCVLAQVSGESLPIELPVDVKATAFQWRVWSALRAIPRGETRTYSEIARTLGQPNAARAVARACATNPVAIVIPCHRVIREDGTMGGYRWGIQRKQALLASEKRKNATPENV